MILGSIDRWLSNIGRHLSKTPGAATAGVILLGFLAVVALLINSPRAADGKDDLPQLAASKAAPAEPFPSIDRLRQQAASRAAPSVVRVNNGGHGIGSGVIMTQDGHIVTNYHVVVPPGQLAVTLANGRTMSARLVGSDPVDDLAVIKVKAQKLPAAAIGDSSKLKVGQSVLAIGNPLGISSTVTEGIVSALNRTVIEGPGGGSILNAVQTSAAINPGNSGGALVDLNGRMIGIPTLTAVDPTFGTPANGVGFAIPSNTVKQIVPQIIQHGKVLHSERPGLGILSETVTPELAFRYGLAADRGVLVARVTPHSAADKAGIRPGDVIVKLDETEITTTSDLLDVLAHKKPRDTARVAVVDRQGQRRMYDVVLGELPVSGVG